MFKQTNMVTHLNSEIKGKYRHYKLQVLMCSDVTLTREILQIIKQDQQNSKKNIFMKMPDNFPPNFTCVSWFSIKDSEEYLTFFLFIQKTRNINLNYFIF